MATAREYFEKNRDLESGRELTVTFGDGESVTASVKVAYDFEGGSTYVRAFIPECPSPDGVLCAILDKIQETLESEKEVSFQMGLAGYSEKITSGSLHFSGRVIVYTPATIAQQRWAHLREQASRNGLSLLIRDGEYVKLRSKHETPLAFISHDSRDKDPLVRELASKLSSLLCPVWYDEYSLIPGQSLRESIERGLKTCPKCVIVLSKNFFTNPGWSKREFDMIYTREVVEGKRVMIPIWLGVTKQEVYDYSPILVDTFGIPASIGIEEVTRRVLLALNYTAPALPA